jgi:hypothetical protein
MISPDALNSRAATWSSTTASLKIDAGTARTSVFRLLEISSEARVAFL